jgi:glycosyltransferase involved in cell wall biosynthesis
MEGRECCARQMARNYQRNLGKATQDEYLQIPNDRGGSEDMINILIRTSGRPKYFEKCIQSILSQKYERYHVFVCYDKGESLEYLRKYKEDPHITYFPIYINSPEKYKFNLYCNLLMDKVTEGYIMFLDDDDFLLHNNVLPIINNALKEHRVVIWTFLRPDKLIAPQDITADIVLGEIASSCVCFDVALVGSATWDDKQYGDFRFYSKLLNPLDKTQITALDFTLAGTQDNDRIGNWGL